MIRKHMLLSGRVQSVGFRYTAYKAANRLHLTGWVRNLPDRRVELEVQGDSGSVSRFLSRVEQMNPYIRITEVQEECRSVVEGEASFTALR